MYRSEFLLSGGAMLAAATLPALQVPGGRTFVVPLPSAPYPHASRAQGHTYGGKLYDAAGHYANSNVGIFVPDGWRPQDGAVDAVVHFYGWNHDIGAAFSTYRLREQFVTGGRNAILIVPEGPTNAPDSGDGKLELDEGGFARFMSDVCAWLVRSKLTSAARPGRIVLTAHSGGYGGAGGVLTRGGMNEAITDVILFDAAYGYLDAFADWGRGAGRRLLSVFTGDTAIGNTAIMGKLQTPLQPNLFVYLSDDITLGRLQTRQHTFILTTTAHDELLQKYDWFSLFLQASALSSR